LWLTGHHDPPQIDGLELSFRPIVVRRDDENAAASLSWLTSDSQGRFVGSVVMEDPHARRPAPAVTSTTARDDGLKAVHRTTWWMAAGALAATGAFAVAGGWLRPDHKAAATPASTTSGSGSAGETPTTSSSPSDNGFSNPVSPPARSGRPPVAGSGGS
jgi:hypothetical protein